MLQHSLRGALGFPVTPFRDDFVLHRDALARNVDEMAGHPFRALVAAGGMGEIYSLDPDEIVEVTRITVEAAAGRMPVIAGAGFNAATAARIARGVEAAGAEGLLVLPPYYANAPEEGLIAYYAAIAAATALPLIGYSRDWAVLSPQAVARLCERVPSLIAWKEGQGDTRRFQRIMQHVGDRLVWLGGAGDDAVPAYYAIGVQGYTSSLSNLAPQLCLELARLGEARDFTALGALLARYVHPLYAIRERMRGYEVAVTKAAMRALGKPAGPVRPPLLDCRPEDAADVGRLMQVYEREFGAVSGTLQRGSGKG